MKTPIRKLISTLCLLTTLAAQTASGFYDPNLQRWLTPDPIGEAGGINLYQFVRNDPVNKVDPDGREVLQYYQGASGQWTARAPDLQYSPARYKAAGLVGVSMVPGVGEAMDVAVLTNPDSKWWEQALAGTSLSLNFMTEGLLPNAGAFLSASKGLCAVPIAKSLVRSNLPDLPSSFARAFDGPVRVRTFRTGEKVYRSPWVPGELVTSPGSWFGTRRTATKTGTDSMYQITKWSNPNQLLRVFEFTEDVSVYYGKVKNGSGYQILFPQDVTPGKVLRFMSENPFR